MICQKANWKSSNLHSGAQSHDPANGRNSGLFLRSAIRARRCASLWVLSLLGCLAQLLSAPAPAPASLNPGPTSDLLPLPGRGMGQHPFLYCGEWQNRSTSQQVMYIVRDGQVDWSYTNPLKGELGDCTMLSNGHII